MTCVSQWHQTSLPHLPNFWELSASGVYISGNVHSWCSCVWRLLTGRNRNEIWQIKRQTIPSSEMLSHDGKGCSRNDWHAFLRGCLTHVQVFWCWFQSSILGHTDRASVHLFACILMTNMFLTVVLSFLYPYNLSQNNSSLSNLNLILGGIVVLQNRNIFYRLFALFFMSLVTLIVCILEQGPIQIHSLNLSSLYLMT